MHRLFLPLCLLPSMAHTLGWAQAPATPPPAPAAMEERLNERNPLAPVVEWSKLEQLSRTLTVEEFQKAYTDFYAGGRDLPPPWLVGPDRLSIKTGEATQPLVSISFRKTSDQPAEPARYWRRVSELPARDEGKPLLSGARIALDPGHIGGDFAAIEERFLSFKEGEAVREGDAALAVAKEIQAELEELGAEVFLVRSENAPVTTARAPDFRAEAQRILAESGVTTPVETYAGLEGDAKIMTLQYQMEKLFYRVSEIRARGARVNEQLRPDFVICLHLNAEPWGPDGERRYSQRNHFHVLINGTYSPHELMVQDERYEMLQRLFHRVHEEELPLAESIAKAMAASTGLPPFRYITPQARAVGTTEYVWARNLLANRLYQCPVIYLEPYVMNHEETYQRMLMGSFRGKTLLNGKLQRSLYTDYARGVVDGIVNYFREKRRA